MSNKILSRITDMGKGWIFSAMDFADLDSRNNIDQALFRLSKTGVIRKLTTGLYDVPLTNNKWGAIPVDPEKAAFALAKKFGHNLQINPVQAANMLGLSQQIPTQLVYLTDGFSKNIQIGNQTITFIRASHKKMLGGNTKAGLIIQALYYFGKDQINDVSLIARIRALLTANDKDMLIDLMPQAPIWMQKTIKDIVHDS
jgi:hypothetical protein